MVKRILVDGLYPENIQVAVVKDDVLEEIEGASPSKKVITGNIYLAKITRIEPGLQAAFIDYGEEKNGFVPFSEIHPNYYNIPGKYKDLGQESEAMPGEAQTSDEQSQDNQGNNENAAQEDLHEHDENIEQPRRKPVGRYKIQEVLKRNQVLLVQAVKEVRGNKGASFTTYISLAGRYCVLMPNCDSSGGISRRISNPSERKKLQKAFDEINEGNTNKSMGFIIRTSGQGKTKKEIKTDYNYLVKQWNDIRQKTLSSDAPAFIYADECLLKKIVVDFYDAQTSEIIVQGDGTYNSIKHLIDFMSLGKHLKVSQFKESMPIFHKFKVDEQISALYDPVVYLRSGAYIVINKTEALTAIDINSGRSTSEKNIEETALKTNMEAAREIARQIRIRDISGLIVIDFIDMIHSRNRRSVERVMRDVLRESRAKVQIGHISPFGLLEISRQRLRPSFLEINAVPCEHCSGTGMIKSNAINAAAIFKMVEFEIAKNKTTKAINVYLSPAMTLFVLNHKRPEIRALEAKYKVSISFLPEEGIKSHGFAMEVSEVIEHQPEEVVQDIKIATPENITKKGGSSPAKKSTQPTEQANNQQKSRAKKFNRNKKNATRAKKQTTSQEEPQMDAGVE